MSARGEPPRNDAAGPSPKEPAPAAESDNSTTNAANHSGNAAREPGKTLAWVPCTWSHPQDLRSQLDRRRQAAARSVPLDCGCRDPWPCGCTNPPLTEHAIDSWRDAAIHTLRTGLLPLVPIEARHALWRRGGADRVLAELLHEACGGEAA